VAQTSKFICPTSFFSAVLSGLASIPTVVNVQFKLNYYKTQKLKLIQAEVESLVSFLKTLPLLVLKFPVSLKMICISSSLSLVGGAWK
jgi:hypothetical protein